jgi:hypothetical protein
MDPMMSHVVPIRDLRTVALVHFENYFSLFFLVAITTGFLFVPSFSKSNLYSELYKYWFI